MIIITKSLSLMKTSKNNLSRKAKPKEILTERQAQSKSNKENDVGWMKTVQLLEQDVERLNRINQLYRHQIEELESDNVAIYTRLQEIQVEHENSLRSQIMQIQRCKLQNQQLSRIIALLEQELRTKDEERYELVMINQDLSQQVKKIDELLEVNEGLRGDIERYKIKLLQSEKYWLTRTQTLITNKEAQGSRALFQQQSDYSLKLRLAKQQIQLKDKIIEQKTQEIHKLIHYIQTKIE